MNIMEKERICEMCGDKGWENAFVFCVNCLEFAIHRYCLPVIPETLDEFVRWFCEDCEEKYGKPSSKGHLIAAERAPCGALKKSKHHNSTKDSSQPKLNLNVTTEKGNAMPVTATDAERHERRRTLRPHGPLSPLAKSDAKVHDSAPSRKKSKKSGKSKSNKKKMSSRPVDVITDPKEQKGQISLSREPCEENNDNWVSAGGKLCEAAASAARVAPDSQIVPVYSSKVQEDSYHIPAQPVIDQIWSGKFEFETDEHGLCDGLVAHLSSKACQKACAEAKLFPESLCMELISKRSVWPRSFQNSEPSDENIALYFFASKKSYKRHFDGLVREMMSKDLALRAVVTNAELLVFTSNELPVEYWKFKGNFYLWGVFRKKHASSSNSASRQLMIQNVENGEYRNLTNNKASDAMSPTSPLSNISSSRWILPGMGEFKINVNASVIADTGRGAMGGLIRDANGRWVHGFFMYLGKFHPQTADLCAIFKGLEIARKLGIRKLIIESDSEEAVEAVASAHSDHLYYIKVIKELMNKDGLCQIKWVSRDANTCADRLTREAFSALTTNEMVIPPEFMLPFLASDLVLGRDGKS